MFNNDGTSPKPKLSICISTYKREKFIAETLESIIPQLTEEVELIIVDGASPDNTPAIVKEYITAKHNIRYFRERENSGIDGDYDKSVSYANGLFCWLMTDDDLIEPNAVSKILASIDESVDLIVLNAVVKNINLTKVLIPNLCKVPADKSYDESTNELFFKDTALALSFIGCVVIRREVWLSRDREKYYGTLFIHVGVIFQATPIANTKVIAAPLISIRYGNAMWAPRGFEIWMFKWPQLIWSFDYSDDTKSAVSMREPWKNIKSLILSRALGSYTKSEYLSFLADQSTAPSRLKYLLIAMLPAKITNLAISIYCLLFNRKLGIEIYSLAKSKNSTWITRLVARSLRISD